MSRTADCPISGDENVLVGADEQFAEYDCPTCGRFKVARAALELTGDEDQGLLHEALQVAKHAVAPGEVPVISNLAG